jgi:hypothetical protein
MGSVSGDPAFVLIPGPVAPIFENKKLLAVADTKEGVIKFVFERTTAGPLEAREAIRLSKNKAFRLEEGAVSDATEPEHSIFPCLIKKEIKKKHKKSADSSSPKFPRIWKDPIIAQVIANLMPNGRKKERKKKSFLGKKPEGKEEKNTKISS